MNKNLAPVMAWDVVAMQEVAKQLFPHADSSEALGEACEAWLASNPDHAVVQHLLGWKLLHDGAFEQALACFEKSMVWGELESTVMVHKAMVQIHLGQGKKALMLCQLLSHQMTKPGLVEMLKACAHLLLYQMDIAVQALQKGLMQAPDWAPLYTLAIPLSHLLGVPLRGRLIEDMQRHFLPHAVQTIPPAQPLDLFYLDQSQLAHSSEPALQVVTPCGGTASQLLMVLSQPDQPQQERPDVVEIEEDTIVERYSKTPLRGPERFVLNWDDRTHLRQAFSLIDQFTTAQAIRKQQAAEILARLAALPSDGYGQDEMPRILLVCSKQHPSFAGVEKLALLLSEQADVSICHEQQPLSVLDLRMVLEQVEQILPHLMVWWDGEALDLPVPQILPFESRLCLEPMREPVAQLEKRPDRTLKMLPLGAWPGGGVWFPYAGLPVSEGQAIYAFAQWLMDQIPVKQADAQQVIQLSDMAPEHQALFQQKNALIQEGRYEEGVAGLEALAARYPNQPELLFILGEVAQQQKRYEAALPWLEKAVQLKPDMLMFLQGLAECYLALEKVEQAEAIFKRILSLDANHHATLLGLANLYLQYRTPVPKLCEGYLLQLMKLLPQEAIVYAALLRYYDAVGQKVQKNWAFTLMNHWRLESDVFVEQPVEDLFFLTPEAALAQAEKQIKVAHTTSISLPQLCFYQGASLPRSDLPHLLAITDKISHYFSRPMLRLPAQVSFDPSDRAQVAKAKEVAELLDQVKLAQGRRAAVVLQQLVNTAPRAVDEGPVRVFAAASRMTTVMQYASARLIQAFKALGCEVHFLIGRDFKEDLTALDLFSAMKEFNPHIVLSINWATNEYYHPDRWNVVWYQDPLADLSKGQPLPWRPRDLVYSVLPYLDEMIKKTGYANPKSQGFCVDLDTFKRYKPWEERRKIIFVGTAYAKNLRLHDENEVALIEQFVAASEAGQAIAPDMVHQMALERGLEPVRICEYVYPYAVRDMAVRWLCELAPELPYEVEIYGYGWEKDPVVAPYFKGVAMQGSRLIQLYNEARYALSPQIHMVNSQRTAEIAACGAVPVVNDHRAFASKPHWDEQLLFFRTKADLLHVLSQKPKKDPYEIAQSFSYHTFARRILADTGLLEAVEKGLEKSTG
ncbi:tetratricopeptide repeat protein [Magnetococcus sp. PR-3]|uniref:tetratricopeptide repeat protein n=1 Tax=Magnetococcus sp. PR-3 TaxID=3120355 RepID=UPI002FCE3F73